MRDRLQLNYVAIIVALILQVSCTTSNDLIGEVQLVETDVFTQMNSVEIVGSKEYPLLNVTDLKIVGDSLYVLSSMQNQLLKFSLDGELLKTVGGKGSGPCEFNIPSMLFADGINLNVLEIANSRIQSFSNNLDCGNISLIPFMAVNAVKHTDSGNFTILGNYSSGAELKFVHTFEDGNVGKSFIDVPDDLLYSYYSADFGGNLIWGNTHSKNFNTVDLNTGFVQKVSILDTTFVSIFDELEDFEVKDQADMLKLMSMTRELSYSQIISASYVEPYVLIAYSNRNGDLPNKLLIQSLINSNLYVTINLGDFRFSPNMGNGDYLIYKYDESGEGRLNAKLLQIETEKLDEIFE